MKPVFNFTCGEIGDSEQEVLLQQTGTPEVDPEGEVLVAVLVCGGWPYASQHQASHQMWKTLGLRGGYVTVKIAASLAPHAEDQRPFQASLERRIHGLGCRHGREEVDRVEVGSDGAKKFWWEIQEAEDAIECHQSPLGPFDPLGCPRCLGGSLYHLGRLGGFLYDLRMIE